MADGQIQKVMTVASLATATVTLTEGDSGVGLGEGRPQDLNFTDAVLTLDVADAPAYFWAVGDVYLVEISRKS